MYTLAYKRTLVDVQIQVLPILHGNDKSYRTIHLDQLYLCELVHRKE